jgi:hypothetical protein
MGLFTGTLTGNSPSPKPSTGSFKGVLTGPQSQQTKGTFDGILSRSSATPTPSNTLGKGYGASVVTDPASGKPLLTYENEALQKSQLLSDRTAPSFDITKPQKIDSTILLNGRMDSKTSADIKSQLESQLGVTAKTQLDHIMPLELGGANTKPNLQLEKTVSGVNTATDPLENQLAADVHAGKISLLEAWRRMAKAKGVTLAEDPVSGSLSSKVPQAPAPAKTGVIQDLIEKGITNFAPFQTLARVAGGESIWGAIKDVYGDRSATSLNAEDINGIIDRRKQLIATGVAPDKATIQATNESKMHKIGAQISGSVGPEADLTDLSSVIRNIAESKSPTAIADLLSKIPSVAKEDVPTL